METYVVIARDHLAPTNIVAEAVPILVRIDIFRLFRRLGLLLSRLLLLPLAASCALHIRDRLLATLCQSNVSLGWRLLASAHARRSSNCRLAKDAMSTELARMPTYIIQLRLLALSFGRWHMTSG